MVVHRRNLRWLIVAGLLLTQTAAAPLLSRTATADDRLFSPARVSSPSAAGGIRLLTFDHSTTRLKHRFQLELQGARTRAEDWLNDTGFSALEDRDDYGKRTYSVVSNQLVERWPALQLRARVGRPSLSAGLRPRREAPAIGVTVPWKGYFLELEGLDDRNLGYAVLGTVRWTDPMWRLHYGVAVPLAFRQGVSIGALLQVRFQF